MLAGLPLMAKSGAAAETVPRTGDLLGLLRTYVTRQEDTLLDLSVANDVGILEMSAANPGVDAWVPGANKLITLPTAHLYPEGPRSGILVNKAELRLYWFPKAGGVETHAIGVGREGLETPLGQTKVVRKAKDPVWRPTADARRDRPELPEVVAAGEDNPMGAYALYLGWPTYAIHGTYKPYSVGRRLSRGCMRLYPQMIERLYQQVPIGTVVTVVDQQVKAGWHGGELYMQAYPDLGQWDELEETYAFTPRVGQVPQAALDLIRTRAGTEAERVDWNLVHAALVERKGLPVQITGNAVASSSSGGWTPPRQPAPAPALPGEPRRPSITGLY